MMSSGGATDCEATKASINENKIAGDTGSIRGEPNDCDGGNSIETIELRQSPGATLGISVKGGIDHPYLVSKDDRAVDAGIFVIHVYAGELAAVDGRLRLGDRILEVNGVNVENVKQKDFITILSSGSKQDDILKLTVKHNDTLHKRLQSKKMGLRYTEVKRANTTGYASNRAAATAPVNGIQFLTGYATPHFEPLEVCANANFINDDAGDAVVKGDADNVVLKIDSCDAGLKGDARDTTERSDQGHAALKFDVRNAVLRWDAERVECSVSNVDGQKAMDSDMVSSDEEDQDGVGAPPTPEEEKEKEETGDETSECPSGTCKSRAEVLLRQNALLPVAGAVGIALLALYFIRRQSRD